MNILELPVEILSSIVGFLGEDHFKPPLTKCDARKQLYSIMHCERVCRRFRDIIHEHTFFQVMHARLGYKDTKIVLPLLCILSSGEADRADKVREVIALAVAQTNSQASMKYSLNLVTEAPMLSVGFILGIGCNLAGSCGLMMGIGFAFGRNVPGMRDSGLMIGLGCSKCEFMVGFGHLMNGRASASSAFNRVRSVAPSYFFCQTKQTKNVLNQLSKLSNILLRLICLCHTSADQKDLMTNSVRLLMILKASNICIDQGLLGRVEIRQLETSTSEMAKLFTQIR